MLTMPRGSPGRVVLLLAIQLLGRQRQEDGEFEASPAMIARYYLKNKIRAEAMAHVASLRPWIQSSVS
jgi:hypothetical protein